ncbi:homoserine kinase [Candidatus Woesearchaeota archaeon]|nr:homoserine kinase [Candidatus Woesearchaeota archaeon]
MKKLKVFAPGTIANLGPAFDILGVALDNIGDTIEVKENNEGVLKIKEIKGKNKRIPFETNKNAVTLGFLEVKKILNIDFGVDIVLEKGLPISGGLGGSSASAVAGVYAANLLAGNKLKKEELLPACVNVEGILSGYHADNVAPSLLGGFILINSYNPLSVVKLGIIKDLYFAIAHPDFELETRKLRAVLPKHIELKQHVFNSSKAASIIAAIMKKDVKLLGKSIQDNIVEPVRSKFIPEFYDVKKAALDAGAYGSSISGSGPSVFAVTDDKKKAESIGKAMTEVFSKKNIESEFYVSKVSMEGVKKLFNKLFLR